MHTSGVVEFNQSSDWYSKSKNRLNCRICLDKPVSPMDLCPKFSIIIRLFCISVEMIVTSNLAGRQDPSQNRGSRESIGSRKDHLLIWATWIREDNDLSAPGINQEKFWEELIQRMKNSLKAQLNVETKPGLTKEELWSFTDRSSSSTQVTLFIDGVDSIEESLLKNLIHEDVRELFNAEVPQLYFNRDQMQQLSRLHESTNRTKIGEDIVEDIYERTGGWPFFAAMHLEEVHQRAKERDGKTMSLEEWIGMDHEKMWVSWKDSPTVQSIIREIRDPSIAQTMRDILFSRGLSIEIEDRELLDRLICTGVIDVSECTLPKFNVGIFSTTNFFLSNLALVVQDGKWNEISPLGTDGRLDFVHFATRTLPSINKSNWTSACSHNSKRWKKYQVPAKSWYVRELITLIRSQPWSVIPKFTGSEPVRRNGVSRGPYAHCDFAVVDTTQSQPHVTVVGLVCYNTQNAKKNSVRAYIEKSHDCFTRMKYEGRPVDQICVLDITDSQEGRFAWPTEEESRSIQFARLQHEPRRWDQSLISFHQKDKPLSFRLGETWSHQIALNRGHIHQKRRELHKPKGVNADLSDLFLARRFMAHQINSLINSFLAGGSPNSRPGTATSPTSEKRPTSALSNFASSYNSTPRSPGQAKKSAPLSPEGVDEDIDPIDEILNVDEDLQTSYSFGQPPRQKTTYSPKVTTKEAENESSNNSRSSLTSSGNSFPTIPKLKVGKGTTKTKCVEAFIGGSADGSGCTETSQEKRICNSLRCIGCDFKVSNFPGYEWREGTDYLFFRNNFPDFDKLKVQLITNRASSAFACQCTWKSQKNLTSVKSFGPEVKWVCGGHYI
ncbi:hypothetical protein PROFUN_14072 [Planoprotostelium fungivorum]|uniref:Cilia- and flagella-associated protein 418 n=1 Tax=Planoprotostelium fungivorum TaxID=1890364 RepID=A0A2P6N1X3_9EUKA|nr:hypothetical protein PROFUN_14072 [Planoprotostelium fungivorum]